MSPGNPVAAANADAALVADAAVARWETIRDVLAPLLGQRGVAALYRRTLHIACRAHPCLSDAVGAHDVATFLELRKVLSQQPADTAAAATDASLQTFHELLGSLVGEVMTQKLLGTTWSPIFSGSPKQDRSK